MTVISIHGENTAVADMNTTSVTVEEEYAKNPDVKREDILELEEWVKTQPHYPPIPERLLILFHHSCYYKIGDTKSCMEVFFNVRSSTPEFFNNRDLSRPELKKALEALQYATIPVKDPNGYQIIFHRLKQFEPSKYVFSDGVKLLVMATEACLYVEGTVPGYIFLFDMKGVRLGHLTRLGVTLLRKFFSYIQEGIPVRLKAIHIVNTLPLIDKVMFLIKPFLKKELLNMIHFHSGDYREVQKYLPPNCLPSDFGGELASCDELHAQFIEWIEKLSDYFKDDERFRVDESKRPSKNKSKSSPPPQITLGSLELD